VLENAKPVAFKISLLFIQSNLLYLLVATLHRKVLGNNPL
jgi:hypothetical protein